MSHDFKDVCVDYKELQECIKMNWRNQMKPRQVHFLIRPICIKLLPDDQEEKILDDVEEEKSQYLMGVDIMAIYKLYTLSS